MVKYVVLPLIKVVNPVLAVIVNKNVDRSLADTAPQMYTLLSSPNPSALITHTHTNKVHDTVVSGRVSNAGHKKMRHDFTSL